VDQGKAPETVAAEFVDPEKKVADVAAALEGAHHILTERLSEMVHLRQFVRDTLSERGFISSTKGEKAKTPSKFENYFSFSESILSLRKPENSHRYLALRRGEAEGELALTMGSSGGDGSLEAEMLARFEREACSNDRSTCRSLLHRAAKFSYKYYVAVSIEAEIHTAIKAGADEAAIAVFADNVRNVLLASPFGAKSVLGVDPGIRTGCKLALVDAAGTFIASAVLHTNSDAERAKGKALLKQLAEKANLKAIAVGNGTAGRETEALLRQFVTELNLSVPVVMVSESGASIYSASDVARAEFPDIDLTIRGAISIARRLQDPLAELVKVDPKSIGVGQYQHDVNQQELKASLSRVVESCVNAVGVNLNTASEYLLSFVAGIGPALAKNIVECRSQNGLFKTRQDILKVPRFGNKAFEQAAGFLRIPGGDNPLDNTGVHPEQYPVLEAYAAKKGVSVATVLGQGVAALRTDKELKQQLGEFSFADVIAELEKPGRDPREDFVRMEFRDGISEIKDLEPGMECPGIVTNVTNFGAFVDIGVHQDGLVHISQLRDSFVKDPRDVVKPGDRVKVRVVEVNLEKKQIALSMRAPGSDGVRAGASRPAGRDGVVSKAAGPSTHRKRDSVQPPPPVQASIGNNPFAQFAAMAKRPK
jgi:uncharacterized protein